MEHKPAMFALLRLHAELGGKIKENRQHVKRLAQNMRHVEAVMKMLEPGYDVTRIAARRRNKSNPWFKRGELFRCALDVLRTAKGSLTTREICLQMLQTKGVTNPTQKQFRDLMGGVQSSLRNHRGKTVDGAGVPVRWSKQA